MGIETTARLCYEDSARLAKALGVPTKTVDEWKAMAELLKVGGIGPQFAEALARSGVMGIGDLKRRSATGIAEDVQAYLDRSDGGQKVTARRVETWQQSAQSLRRVRQKVPAR